MTAGIKIDLSVVSIHTNYKDIVIRIIFFWMLTAMTHSKICVCSLRKTDAIFTNVSYLIHLQNRDQNHYSSLSDCPIENCKFSIFKTAQSGSMKVLCLQGFPDRHFNCIKLWLRNEAGPAVNILCKYKPFKQKIKKINGNKEIF